MALSFYYIIHFTISYGKFLIILTKPLRNGLSGEYVDNWLVLMIYFKHLHQNYISVSNDRSRGNASLINMQCLCKKCLQIY